MKNIFKISLVGVATILTVAALAVLPKTSAANTGTLTMTHSPVKTTYVAGDTITFTIYEDSGAQAMNSVRADLAFDSTKLQFMGASVAGTNFTGVSGTGTSSTATLVSYVVPPSLGGPPGGTLSGKQTVGTVTLKVNTVTTAGSTDVSFTDVPANASGIASGGSDIWDRDTTTNKTTLSLSAPAPTPTPTPPPVAKTCPSGYTGTYPNCVAPKAKTGSTTTVVTPTPTQQQADPATPVPASVVTTTNSGYFVGIKVVDDSGKPVSGATVTIEKQSAKSDSSGEASFNDIAAGSHKVTVSSSKVKGESTINVDGNLSPTTAQQFEVKTKPKLNLTLFVGIGAIVVVVIIGLVMWHGGMGSGLMKKGPGANGHDHVVATVGGSTPPSAASINQDNVLKPTIIAPYPGSGTPKA